MEKCPVNPDKWKLYQYNEFLGYFDAVVIAHNGKCADRLISTTGDLRCLSNYFCVAYVTFYRGNISSANIRHCSH
jgi:hypothetical protein